MTQSRPIRTCVGCGERAPQSDLVRFIAAGDALVVAGRGRRAPGRGAYLHGRPVCWAAFAKRRGSVRSLRWTPSPAARERLVESLETGGPR